MIDEIILVSKWKKIGYRGEIESDTNKSIHWVTRVSN